MAFDGIVTAGIVAEMNDKIVGSRIDKVYQPEQSELLFHIKKHRLFVSSQSAHPHVSFKESYKGNPAQPPNFCMLLRKHIQGGIIRSVRQYESERVIEIEIDTINELGFSKGKILTIEIMGKHSNVILVDGATNKVIDSIKHVSIDMSRDRQVLPGLEYTYPPSQGKVSFYDLPEGYSSDNLVKEVQGVSPSFADGIDSIYATVERIKNDDFSPCVYVGGDKVLDFHVFHLAKFEGDAERIDFRLPSEAINYYYTNRESSNRIKQKGHDIRKSLKSKLDKLYLKKQRLSEDLLRAESAEKYKLYGELLTANQHAIPGGNNEVELLNYYTDEKIKVKLDPLRSVSQNAQDYYKRYNKSKTAMIQKKVQLNENQREITYLESVLSFVENADSIEALDDLREELVETGFMRNRKKSGSKNKKAKPNPNEFVVDGFKILVGRNNIENDFITFKRAAKDDLWFHTKDIPGSHVILMKEGHEPEEVTLHKVAEIAAYFSKGQESQTVPVDYCEVKYVKKPSGAKPGMVIFKNNRTIYADPAKPGESNL